MSFITHVNNIVSILKNGVISYRLSKQFEHLFVASEIIQERRAKKRIPGGGLLHDYVNLYFCARNPMLYSLRDRYSEISILRVNSSVLDLPDVIVADSNASSGYVRFLTPCEGVRNIDKDLILRIIGRIPMIRYLNIGINLLNVLRY